MKKSVWHSLISFISFIFIVEFFILQKKKKSTDIFRPEMTVHARLLIGELNQSAWEGINNAQYRPKNVY